MTEMTIVNAHPVEQWLQLMVSITTPKAILQ